MFYAKLPRLRVFFSWQGREFVLKRTSKRNTTGMRHIPHLTNLWRKLLWHSFLVI